MWFSFLAIGFRGWFGIGWLAALLVLGFILFCKRRRLERNVMLYSALDVLQPDDQRALMESFAKESMGQLPRLARGVARDLDKGIAWGRSLERWGVGRGVYEVLSLRLLDRFGTQDVRSQAPAELTPIQIESEVERLLARFSVFIWVLFALPVLGLLATFIIPTFKEMFEEFGMEVPWAFSLFTGNGPPVFSILLVLFGLGVIVLAGTVACAWMFPKLLTTWPLRLLCRDYFRSVGLTALGAVASRESDLEKLLDTTSQVIPVNFVAQPYSRASLKIQQGLPIADALTQSGIIGRRELGDFVFRLSGPDTMWTLRQYASWRIQRMLGRYSLLVQFLIVGLTLILAACVCLIGMSVFSALTTMTNTLAEF